VDGDGSVRFTTLQLRGHGHWAPAVFNFRVQVHEPVIGDSGSKRLVNRPCIEIEFMSYGRREPADSIMNGNIQPAFDLLHRVPLNSSAQL
jgi:hypothetical protein